MSFKFLSIYMDIDKNLEHCSLQAHALCHSSLSYDYFDISTYHCRVIIKKRHKKYF